MFQEIRKLAILPICWPCESMAQSDFHRISLGTRDFPGDLRIIWVR